MKENKFGLLRMINHEKVARKYNWRINGLKSFISKVHLCSVISASTPYLQL